MVRLMTAANAVQARIIAARLGSEGIVWEFRGSVDGPLAVGPVEVLVDADGFAAAKELLMVDDIESAFATEPQPVRETTTRDVVWVALALVGLILFAIVRMTALA
jgi:hypothetical protein